MRQKRRWTLVAAVLLAACSTTDAATTTSAPPPETSTSAAAATTTAAPLLRAEWSPAQDLPADVRSALEGIAEEHGAAFLVPARPPVLDWHSAAVAVVLTDDGPQASLHVGPADAGLTVDSRPGVLPCGTSWETVDVRGSAGCAPRAGPQPSLRWVEGDATFDATWLGLDREAVVAWLDTWSALP